MFIRKGNSDLQLLITFTLSLLLIAITAINATSYRKLRNENEKLKEIITNNSIISISDLKFLDNDFIISNDTYIITIKRKKIINNGGL